MVTTGTSGDGGADGDGDGDGGDSVVTIVSLYPHLLGTYGDGGNARVLSRRLAWRGIKIREIDVAPGDPIPVLGDVYLLGGGEDDAQVTACELLAGGALGEAADKGAVIFAVCAGFQLLGTEFAIAGGGTVPGLGLLDVSTERLPERAVGEVVSRCLLDGCGDELLTGFENHAGATRLGPGVQPLGAVVQGTGNGVGNVDGAVAGRIVGTYLHGPVLARNAGLADCLLSWITGPLPRIDDAPVDHLHETRLRDAS